MIGYCENCKQYTNLEKHHSHHGTANRKICDNYPKMLFYLCFKCHRGTNGVHGRDGGKLNKEYKKLGQERYELNYGDRAEFIRLFGRNYL